MYEEHPHHLLAQVPLTVSPFLSLPTSVPLPYSYKSLPSTLPPSILNPQPQPLESGTSTPQPPQPPAYVVSSSGTTATPDQILSSCVALQQHLAKLEADARRTLSEWEEKRRQDDLVEKRRVAPGWLDNDVHILKPENVSDGPETRHAQSRAKPTSVEAPQLRHSDAPAVNTRKEGEELDRAFGGLQV